MKRMNGIDGNITRDRDSWLGGIKDLILKIVERDILLGKPALNFILRLKARNWKSSGRLPVRAGRFRKGCGCSSRLSPAGSVSRPC